MEGKATNNDLAASLDQMRQELKAYRNRIERWSRDFPEFDHELMVLSHSIAELSGECREAMSVVDPEFKSHDENRAIRGLSMSLGVRG